MAAGTVRLVTTVFTAWKNEIMRAPKSGFDTFTKNLRNVLMSTSSDSAAQAVRTQGFRASLVDDPLNSQVDIGKTLVALRERSSRD